MSATVYSILIVIVAQALYQLAMKAVPGGSNPLATLVVVYALALVACLILAPLTGKALTVGDLRKVISVPALLLAAAVVGIEVGYLLAYRNGWTLGITYALTSVTTVAILALVGLLHYGETLDTRRIAGLLFALFGSWLLVSQG
jgi:drug/metabolite transporter (DMT)-like permease